MRPEEEIFEAELLPDEEQSDVGSRPEKPPTTRQRLIEQVLNPHALQWMMICGGGMLILGFVIWLWSVGIFENPMVVASVVGAATLGALAAGVAMVRLTRYQLAGRGVALLGSIALPLNLWLYDAQGLVTLADGGHLWIPAALCCLIYAAVARVLKDSSFVYALVGGVVMTGMLFLADETVGRFWTLMPPVSFLVIIGWMSTFAEQLFNDDEGDFSRQNFGLAFHRAGLMVVFSGLALLLGNHAMGVINWCLGHPLFSIVTSQPQKVWSLGVITASAAGFGFLGVLKPGRLYRIATTLLVAWSIPIVLDVFSITVSVSQLAIVVALLITAGNVFLAWIRTRTTESKYRRFNATILKTVEELSLAATGAVGVLAMGQFFAQFEYPEGIALFAPVGWGTVFQITTAALAAFALGFRAVVESDTNVAKNHESRFMIGAGSVMITAGILTAIMVQGLLSDQVAMAVALLSPVLVAAASFVTKNRGLQSALRLSGSVLMTAHLMMRGFVHVASESAGWLVFDLPSLQWSVVFAMSAAVYWIVSIEKVQSFSRVISYVSSTLAVAMAGQYLGFEFGYCLVLAPMIVGTAMRVLETLTSSGKRVDATSVANTEAGSLLMTANALVLGSGMAGVLMALSRWVSSDASGTLLLVMIIQLACLTLTSLLTKHPAWRAAFRALIVMSIGASVCVFDGWLSIDGWQRLELCSLLGGAILLILSHMSLMREDSQTDDLASVGLLVGSFMVAVPMAIGLLVYRLGFAADANWMQFHEIITIATALALFGTGVLCRLRATTISGAALLSVYLMSLLTLIRWPDQLQSVSVMMMIGGGIFFVTALLMSICRDRLMTLPKRIREGEGVYQILKWR